MVVNLTSVLGAKALSDSSSENNMIGGSFNREKFDINCLLKQLNLMFVPSSYIRDAKKGEYVLAAALESLRLGAYLAAYYNFFK